MEEKETNNNNTFGIIVVVEFNSARKIDYPSLAEKYSQVLMKFFDNQVFKMLFLKRNQLSEDNHHFRKLIKKPREKLREFFDKYLTIRIIPIGLYEQHDDDANCAKFLYLIQIKDKILQADYIPHNKTLNLDKLPIDCQKILNDNFLMDKTRAMYVVSVLPEYFNYLYVRSQGKANNEIVDGQFTFHEKHVGNINDKYIKHLRLLAKVFDNAQMELTSNSEVSLLKLKPHLFWK